MKISDAENKTAESNVADEFAIVIAGIVAKGKLKRNKS